MIDAMSVPAIFVISSRNQTDDRLTAAGKIRAVTGQGMV
jgi:hypothetical protein